MKRVVLGVSLVVALAFGPDTVLRAQPDRAESALRIAIETETVKGDLKGAIEQYTKITERYGANRDVTAQALLRLAGCLSKTGQPGPARAIYDRILHEYPDQAQVRAAAERKVSGGGSVPRGLTERIVWSGADVTLDGRPSADGRYVGFTDWESGGNLAVRDLNSGTNRLLTRHASVVMGNYQYGTGAYTAFPRFLPGDKAILYNWHAGGVVQLRLIGIDGSEDRLVLANQEFEPWLGAVSPDGRSAAVTLWRGDRTRQLAIVSIESGVVRPLKSLEWREPAIGNFSPDGHRIAYSVPVRQNSEEREIFTIAIDGSSEASVLRGPGKHLSPFYSNDGNRLVFPSDRSGQWALWTVPLSKGRATGPATVVKQHAGRTAMGFSRGGSFFTGEVFSSATTFVVDSLKTGASSRPKALTDRNGDTHRPRFSPDGKYVAYVSDVRALDSGRVVWTIRELPSGREREFTVRLPRNTPAYATALHWASDSQRLIAPGFRDETGAMQPGFRYIDVETGREANLLAADIPPAQVAFAPGERFIFSSPRESPQPSQTNRLGTLLRHPVPVGVPDTVHTAPTRTGRFDSLSLSPDGSRLLFTQDQTIRVIAIGGGDVKTLVIVPDTLELGDVAWMPDGQSILFVQAQGVNAARQSRVYQMAIGGAPIATEITMPWITNLSIHPDGHRLAFRGTTGKQEISVLENLVFAGGTSQAGAATQIPPKADRNLTGR